MARRIAFLFLLAVLVGLPTAYAQTKPVNPTTVSFTASSDHTQVTSYRIGYFVSATAATPVQEDDLGKPTPDASNQITVAINSKPLAFAVVYLAKVRAMAGTVSSDWSDPSNPFDRKPGKSGTPVIR